MLKLRQLTAKHYWKTKCMLKQFQTKPYAWEATLLWLGIQQIQMHLKNIILKTHLPIAAK